MNPSRSAFVRRPSPRLADGLVTHMERSPDVDISLAERQWRGYVDVLHDAGYRTREVVPAPDCPDSVLIEDAMVELADAPVAGVLALDGGDVLKVGDTAYVGVGGRTTQAGADALGHHLSAVGRRVVAVAISTTLHLKSQVTALPGGTVVGYEPLVDDPACWPSFIAVPEPEGAHVVTLGDHTVLMADQAPRTADLYRERGLEVITVPMSEFIKLEGCVTCLSVRLHEAD